jgi:hypothetical protein
VWRRLKDDSFELGNCGAAKTKCRLKALEPKFAGVGRPDELGERRAHRGE